MNISYKFNEKSHPELIKFLKIASEQSKFNINCDLNTHNKLGKFIQIDPEVQLKLQNSLKEDHDNDNICISISSSDEEEGELETLYKTEKILEDDNIDNDDILQEISHFLSSKNCDPSQNLSHNEEDLPSAIKESLELEKTVPQSILNNLKHCTNNTQIQSIFTSLNNSLNITEILHFGRNIFDLKLDSNNAVLINYFRLLFLKAVRSDFCENVQKLLWDFFDKYDNLIRELSIALLDTDDDNTTSDADILIQYINSLPLAHKLILMRYFIDGCTKLEDKYLALIENLLNNQLEHDTLKKLVELMSNSADEFSNNKCFGKLLFNILNMLSGSNVQDLEQPLKHVIGRHNSIWKPKIQKVYRKSVEDSTFLTQSLR